MTLPKPLTVSIPSDLLPELDEHFSPMDAATALEQLTTDLPRLHQSEPLTVSQLTSGAVLRLHRGRFGWSDLGFDYVQHGGRITITRFWPDAEWNTLRGDDVRIVLGEHTA